jgi:hypothetical protein
MALPHALQERLQTEQLEELLPLVAYGSATTEDPAALRPRHLAQLIGLGQAALDYLAALLRQTGPALVSAGWGAADVGGGGWAARAVLRGRWGQTRDRHQLRAAHRLIRTLCGNGPPRLRPSPPPHLASELPGGRPARREPGNP